MKHVLSYLFGALVMMSAVSPVMAAPTILQIGEYEGLDPLAAELEPENEGPLAFIGYKHDPGPGRYEYYLTKTTPILPAEMIVFSEIRYNFVCPEDYPDNWCGGNNYYKRYPFKRVGPYNFKADVFVQPRRLVHYWYSAIYYDVCCEPIIQFQARTAGTYTLSIAEVPEPDTWLLMLTGFGAVGTMLRRRPRRFAQSPA